MSEHAETIVEIPLHALNTLHEDALRYRFLRAWAHKTDHRSDGTGRWSVPQCIFDRHWTQTFDEAVDAIRDEIMPLVR